MTDWKYIHHTATPHERDEITQLILQRAAARQRRLVLVRGRLILDRRGPSPRYHVVGDTRALGQRWRYFDPPNHANTLRVIIVAIIGTSIVAASSLAAATLQPGILLTVPAYVAWVAYTLYQRHQQLTTAPPVE
jgi:hypothetical protein